MDHITKKNVELSTIKFDRDRLFHDIHDKELGIHSSYFKDLVNVAATYPKTLPPIFIDCDGVLIDGYHRYIAFRLLGTQTVEAYVYHQSVSQLPGDTPIKIWKIMGDCVDGYAGWTEEKDQLLRQLIKAHLGDSYADDEVYYVGVFPTNTLKESGEERGLRVVWPSEGNLKYPYSENPKLGTFTDDIFSEILEE